MPQDLIELPRKSWARVGAWTLAILGPYALLAWFLLSSLAQRDLALANAALFGNGARHVEVQKRLMALRLLDQAADLRFLAGLSSVRVFLSDPSDQARAWTRQDLLDFSLAKGAYDQVRLLGLDGRELLRVNLNQGTPSAVPLEGLQDKSDSRYVQETLRLQPGDVHLSPLDLNVEQGRLEQPLKPVYRLCAPVAGRGGEAVGMVVLNVLAGPMLAGLEESGSEPWRIYLVNRQGDWLKGPTPEDEWGRQIPERSDRSIHSGFPGVLSAAAGKASAHLRTARGYFRLETVRPVRIVGAAPSLADEPMWTIVAFVPAEELARLEGRAKENSMLLFALTALVVGILALLLANSAENRRMAQQSQALYAAAMGEVVAGLQRKAADPDAPPRP